MSARLSTLLAASGVRALGPTGADPEILGAGLDSRRIQPGDLFFAIRGFQHDGETYVPQALERGAVAVVAITARPPHVPAETGWVQVEDPRGAAALLSRECYGRPDEDLSLVGVTGTNGKTTVTHLIEAIATAAGRRCGRIGTTGLAYGGREVPLARTTPEAPEFYRLLAEMRDHGIEVIPMEVSSHALSLRRVEGARFVVGAFLNLSPDHLDFHTNQQDYFNAKARLFESLDSKHAAVLPADDPRGAELAARTRARVLTFGRSGKADVRLVEEHCGLDGSSAILLTPSGKLPIRSFLLGATNLENVAAAATCALALELPPESIPSGVLNLSGVAGRMERVERDQPFTVLVDYAHTSAALAQLLDWARQVTRGRVLLVFGAGGARDSSKRPVMGRVAAGGADELFVTSDNPRHEDPQRILDEIAVGVKTERPHLDHCRLVVDRQEAICAAIAAARPGDLVLIAGKGHETTQTIGGRDLPFDDRKVAAACLERLGWGGGDGAVA